MTNLTRERLEALAARAAKRSMTVQPAPEGFQLASPYRVVCCGSLDQIADWLTAAEENDLRSVAPPAVGFSPDY
ncbi:hypothetical protein ACFU44_00520 [Nocardia rhizosphaerihabitans]|uniref:hypothetical protein n=1 Tax=Nocardia rhizosphaerihabitans TaxID=1691570 RepID=UPI00366B15DA